MRLKNKLIINSLAVFLFTLFLPQALLASVLDNWKSPLAYKPKPVLFLHGFARGNPGSWQNAASSLREYFNKYEDKGPFLRDSGSNYLELISFDDPNGSIDTYPAGKTNPHGTNEGWADKVETAVSELLYSAEYGTYTEKINLVCHSMGGLAAREYLTNYNGNTVDKLITIGTPHLGANLATAANGLVLSQEIIGMFNVRNIIVYSMGNKMIGSALDLFAMLDLNGEAINDMDPSVLGSGFIDKLNMKIQPSDVDYGIVVGVSGSLSNWLLFGNYYGGDGIVSTKSQYGTNVVSYRDSTEISASHFQETNVVGSARGRDNIILKFLDDIKPEIEITEPNPTASPTTEIKTLTTRLKGKVFKEYLPADTSLKITIVREEDNSSRTLGTDGSIKIKASDLWNSNDSSSPVAEFDEEINFWDVGAYTIKVTAVNPAGINSDEKTTRIEVMLPVVKLYFDFLEGLYVKGVGADEDFLEARAEAWNKYLSDDMPDVIWNVARVGQRGYYEQWVLSDKVVENKGYRGYVGFDTLCLRLPKIVKLVIKVGYGSQLGGLDYHFNVQIYKVIGRTRPIDIDWWGSGTKFIGTFNTADIPTKEWNPGYLAGDGYFTFNIAPNDINFEGDTIFEFKSSSERIANPVPLVYKQQEIWYNAVTIKEGAYLMLYY